MRVVILLLFFLSFLFSHKLNLFVFEDNEKIIVNSYFASGSFCKECKLEVFDINNKLLESGKTDKNGEYIIKNFAKRVLIKVEALGGHAVINEFEVKNLKAKEKIENQSTFLQSFIALFLIFFILFLLKRFKK